MILALVIGVSLGVIAAIKRDRWPDQIIRVISLAGVSVPTFWLALVTLYVFFFKLGIAPGVGRLNPGGKAPPSITNMFTIDALLTGQWSTLGTALSHLVLPATGARHLHDRLDHPLHPRGDAGIAQPGLCPLGPRQGAAGRGP